MLGQPLEYIVMKIVFLSLSSLQTLMLDLFLPHLSVFVCLLSLCLCVFVRVLVCVIMDNEQPELDANCLVWKVVQEELAEGRHVCNKVYANYATSYYVCRHDSVDVCECVYAVCDTVSVVVFMLLPYEYSCN